MKYVVLLALLVFPLEAQARVVIKDAMVRELLEAVKDGRCTDANTSKLETVYFMKEKRRFKWSKKYDLFLENANTTSCKLFKRKA